MDDVFIIIGALWIFLGLAIPGMEVFLVMGAVFLVLSLLD